MADHFEHTTGPGERWDLIAFRFYGDASRQKLLIEANRSLFDAPGARFPAILPAGLVLRVPVIAQAADETTLPPWKRNQPAEGTP